MSDKTGIAWTDATWNPVRGCALVSAGCTNCYAMKQAHRFNGKGGAYEGLTKMTSHGPTWTGKVRTVPEVLEQPLRWHKPRRIFVNSMSDLFHNDVPDEFIADVFAVMARCQQHTFQILTKRPERMQQFCSREPHWWGNKADIAGKPYYGKPLPNVWLGVSVEDQQRADERIPLLLQTPAAVRFLSCEPLLEEIVIPGVNAHSSCRAPTRSSLPPKVRGVRMVPERLTESPDPSIAPVPTRWNGRRICVCASSRPPYTPRRHREETYQGDALRSARAPRLPVPALPPAKRALGSLDDAD